MQNFDEKFDLKAGKVQVEVLKKTMEDNFVSNEQLAITTSPVKEDIIALTNLSGELKHQLDILKRDVLGDITSAVKKVAR